MHDQDGHTSYVMALVNDVTAQMEQTQIIDAARQEIEQQRETIRTLATPVAQVWEGILTVPIQGALDAERAMAMTENLLEAIVAHQAEQVILDITGVPVVDTQVANYLLTAAHACHLLGSEVALVGISSSIAQTIVHLGVDLSGIITHTNLQAGIAWALKRQGLVVQHHAACAALPVANAHRQRSS
jgi:rsbT co-antagonist protein RsbR